MKEKKLNRLEDKLCLLDLCERKAFVPYVTAGHPDARATVKIVLALDQAGADVVELGIPFSDPMADGKTIQESSQKALLKGMNMTKALGLVKEIRKTSQIPLVFMTYYNVIYQFGIKAFAQKAGLAGLDGVIVPDLPVEESGLLAKECAVRGLSLIFLLAPTSTPERIDLIAHKSHGFIYYVSLTGITGARTSLPKHLKERVGLIRRATNKPVLVGFGISTPAQARAVAKIADGVIVGSALVSVIEKNSSSMKKLIPAVTKFTRSLAQAVHGA